MKAVLILHNEAIDNDVNGLLESADVKHYTKFTNVLGKGGLSSPHLNTEIWPEKNYGTLAVVEENTAKIVMDKVRQARKNLGSEGIKAFMWEIEDIT